ncbi:uncharacterized membrane protein YkvA (DUF1232 family) [Bacillus ectoiniformans]|uniref:YkvA family protein n=1 Tax=Bacillus ectoiniformans TaxID=1494429 RepID=UPI00195A0C93|nr:DUF1232 domain-containing protein [Bacillus ectoiniformans]MBM7649855.1 uncharacterized membrane protein YkvA (DUF1232 family) [Bacillus ectoiniformans]
MWRFWKRIKFLLNIRKSLPFLKDFFISPEVSIVKKLLSIGVIAGYFLLPLDFIPDFFTFIGVLDDLTVFTFMLQLIVKMAPETLKIKHRLK